MKLLLCKECQDIVRLIDTRRVCKCGKVGGKYTDGLNAIYFGDMAVPLGLSNGTLVNAVRKRPESGMGENFTAFVVPKLCSTFKLVLEHEC